MKEMFGLSKRRGLQFHQTVMGNEYYEFTIPQLIDSMNQLTYALNNKSNLEIPEDIKQAILSNMIRLAKIHPDSNFFRTTGGCEYYQHILPNLIRAINELTQAINNKTKEED